MFHLRLLFRDIIYRASKRSSSIHQDMVTSIQPII